MTARSAPAGGPQAASRTAGGFPALGGGGRGVGVLGEPTKLAQEFEIARCESCDDRGDAFGVLQQG